MVILLSPANSQSEFAPNSQYCEFQAEFAANSCCERIRSEFGEFKLNSLRICIPSILEAGLGDFVFAPNFVIFDVLSSLRDPRSPFSRDHRWSPKTWGLDMNHAPLVCTEFVLVINRLVPYWSSQGVPCRLFGLADLGYENDPFQTRCPPLGYWRPHIRGIMGS